MNINEKEITQITSMTIDTNLGKITFTPKDINNFDIDLIRDVDYKYGDGFTEKVVGDTRVRVKFTVEEMALLV